MKHLLLSFLLIGGLLSCKQDKTLLQQKKQFDKALKGWASTFSEFNLSSFTLDTVRHFENKAPQAFIDYKNFLFIYKPIITFSPDGLKFIDLYSVQIHLQKKGNYYEASPDDYQAVLLCNPKTKYWN